MKRSHTWLRTSCRTSTSPYGGHCPLFVGTLQCGPSWRASPQIARSHTSHARSKVPPSLELTEHIPAHGDNPESRVIALDRSARLAAAVVPAAVLSPDRHARAGRPDAKGDCRCPGHHDKRSRHPDVASEGASSRTHGRQAMTTPRDPYWDELGVAWSAINPDIDVIAPRLKARLRRQSLLITAGASLQGCLSALLAYFLGALTIWSGWTTGTWNFVTRGIAIVAISVILAISVAFLLPVRASDAARAVSDMIRSGHRPGTANPCHDPIGILRVRRRSCGWAGGHGDPDSSHETAPDVSGGRPGGARLILALGLFVYGRRVKVTL